MLNKYLLMYVFLMIGKQSNFLQHVNYLTRTMSHMGNPFMDTCGDLLVLDTRTIVDSTVGDTIQKIEKLGQEMCDTFFKNRLVDCIRPLSDTVTIANIRLFCSRQHKEKSRDHKQLKAMKLDRTLFSTLYIVCQVRQISMTEFFSHENRPYPCSLSLRVWLYEMRDKNMSTCMY